MSGAVDLLPLAAGAEQKVDTGGAVLENSQLNGTLVPAFDFHFSGRLCLPPLPSKLSTPENNDRYFNQA